MIGTIPTPFAHLNADTQLRRYVIPEDHAISILALILGNALVRVFTEVFRVFTSAFAFTRRFALAALVEAVALALVPAPAVLDKGAWGTRVNALLNAIIVVNVGSLRALSHARAGIRVWLVIGTAFPLRNGYEIAITLTAGSLGVHFVCGRTTGLPLIEVPLGSSR